MGDGSTAIEVAIKMALKLYQTRFPSKSNNKNLTCIAHEDCYHGDTLGAMNIALPSIFNKGQQPWFQSKGCFLNSPTISFINNKLTISHDYLTTKTICTTIDDIYNIEYRLINEKELCNIYKNHIISKWDEYESNSGEQNTIAFTFIEPLV